jgi:Tol biopolymer transport system component
VPVLADVSGDTSSGASYFSIADDGSVAWLPGGEPEQTRNIVSFDRAGRFTVLPIAAGPYLGLKLSPDASRALVLAGPGGGSADLWLADLTTGALNRLTHGGQAGLGAWLPDGVRIVHSHQRPDGGQVIVVRRLDGAGGEREIASAPNPLFVTDVARDGRAVIYSDFGKADGRLHAASVDDAAPAREIAAEGDGYEQVGVLSPDGRWLAYVSNKTRREEVCLRRADGSGGSWQLSNHSGGGPRWGRDGRELFFIEGEKLVRLALVPQGDGLSIGQPETLFDVPPSPIESTYRDYDYDPVHDRFLFTRPPRGVADGREIAVSLGWAKRLGNEDRARR